MNEKIKELRLARGFKQKDMADWLHISVSAYSNKETGNRSFRASELVLLAQKFGITEIKDLF